jgi:hypothetical protein
MLSLRKCRLGSAVGEAKKKSRWVWQLGLLATGLAGAAVMVFRGCWHRKMSWPVRSQECSYQVCMGCGVKRLFDEKSFQSYGPFSYDLNQLVAWERAQTAKFEQIEKRPVGRRPAS